MKTTCYPKIKKIGLIVVTIYYFAGCFDMELPAHTLWSSCLEVGGDFLFLIYMEEFSY